MAASQAKLSLGASFKMGSAAVEELDSIGGPAIKAGTPNVTNMDSPSGWAEFIAGIIDAGSITLSGNWIGSTNQKALVTAVGAAASAMHICLPGSQPSAGHWDFNGIVDGFSMDMKHDKQISFSASVKITGIAAFSVS
jgi:predicted secreted protein